MNILIVEDDRGIRDMLLVFLRHSGYDVTAAANGHDALIALQQGSEMPHLIVLDLMMPVMNGAEFRLAQRHDPILAAIPVAVMSAAENLRDTAPILAAEAYLAKPIDFAALLETVERYCGTHRMQSA